MKTIWGGSRVRVTTSWDPRIPEGTEGRNLGHRQGEGEQLTVLVLLDGGREARLPLHVLEPIERTRVPDGHGWKTDIPESNYLHHVKTVGTGQDGRYRYEIRGYTGRWFVQRFPLAEGSDEPTKRTPFFPNQRLALAAMNDLIGG